MGHVDARRRVLTGAVTVMIVLGLCLFRRESTSVVTARIPRTRVESTPTAAAVSKARGRLPAAVHQQVFTTGARSTPMFGPESYAFGLLVTAIDGTVFDLADTERTGPLPPGASSGLTVPPPASHDQPVQRRPATRSRTGHTAHPRNAYRRRY
ncbi:transposase domain-containing protein [Micromonospora sp. LOL_013]|uniref:transposase domain-containing protein n=1 Tax=Micromonospora sp. LOL_013 TaxID=3345414 RepID=UPI003A870EBA